MSRIYLGFAVLKATAKMLAGKTSQSEWPVFLGFANTQRDRQWVIRQIVEAGPEPSIMRRFVEQKPWALAPAYGEKKYRWWDVDNVKTLNDDMVIRSL